MDRIATGNLNALYCIYNNELDEKSYLKNMKMLLFYDIAEQLNCDKKYEIRFEKIYWGSWRIVNEIEQLPFEYIRLKYDDAEQKRFYLGSEKLKYEEIIRIIEKIKPYDLKIIYEEIK